MGQSEAMPDFGAEDHERRHPADALAGPPAPEQQCGTRKGSKHRHQYNDSMSVVNRNAVRRAEQGVYLDGRIGVPEAVADVGRSDRPEPQGPEDPPEVDRPTPADRVAPHPRQNVLPCTHRTEIAAEGAAEEDRRDYKCPEYQETA